MTAKDRFHKQCVRALQKDGWLITDDPLRVSVGKTDLLIDLGAERLIGAERAGERIAVEIKSFLKLSQVQDLKEALGQFVMYTDALEQSPLHSDRILYLAVRAITYDDVFAESVGAMLLNNKRLRLIVFDPDEEAIVQWIE